MLGNFFIAYKLRDLQMIGTSWIFVVTYFGLTVIWTVLNFVAAINNKCTDHEL